MVLVLGSLTGCGSGDGKASADVGGTPTGGPSKGLETGSDPAEGSGAACLQGFKSAGAKADGRSTVYSTAWKDVATAIGQYKYVLSSASKEAAAFRSDLRLVVRDSNLECDVQGQNLTPLFLSCGGLTGEVHPAVDGRGSPAGSKRESSTSLIQIATLKVPTKG